MEFISDNIELIIIIILTIIQGISLVLGNVKGATDVEKAKQRTIAKLKAKNDKYYAKIEKNDDKIVEEMKKTNE